MALVKYGLVLNLILMLLIIGKGLNLMCIMDMFLNDQNTMKTEMEIFMRRIQIQEDRIQKLESEANKMKRVINQHRKEINRQKRSSAQRLALNNLTTNGKMARMPQSCEDLQEIGHSLSGFYSVRGLTRMEQVFCDFSLPLGDPDFEQWIGSIDVQSSAVYFYALSGAAYGGAGTAIPFQTEKLNIGYGMNISSGVFTAPTTGIYLFNFSALKNNAQNGVNVYLHCNNVLVGSAYGGITGDTLTLSLSSTLRLRVGDQIKLVLGSGVLYGNVASYTHFTGVLLRQDLFE